MARRSVLHDGESSERCGAVSMCVRRHMKMGCGRGSKMEAGVCVSGGYGCVFWS